MMIEHHPGDDMNAAAQVAKSTVLQQIQPQKVFLESKLRDLGLDSSTEFAAAFNHKEGTFELKPGGLLDVLVGAEVRFFVANESDEPPTVEASDWVARIELQFVLTYRVPEGPVPQHVEQIGLPAFARIFALNACWPYIRHEVNHLASELGIAFIMPILVQDPKRVERQAETRARTSQK